MPHAQVLEMTKLLVVIGTLSCTVVGLVVCLGVDESVYTSKVTAARKNVCRVFLPFWRSPGQSVVIYHREESIPSAVEVFLLRHAVHHMPSDEQWNLDHVARFTLWGLRYHITPIAPGRYLLCDSFGDEILLSEFLESRQQASPEFASQIVRFLQDPTADWAVAWQRQLRHEYYEERYGVRAPLDVRD